MASAIETRPKSERGISSPGFLLSGQPSGVVYLPEPLYEEPVENHTQTTERDHKIRNQQLKVTWQNRCKTIDETGPSLRRKPWDICDQKTTSLLYPCIGTDGCRIFPSKHPHSLFENETLKKIWKIIKILSEKTRSLYTIYSSFSPENNRMKNLWIVSTEDLPKKPKIVVWATKKLHS